MQPALLEKHTYFRLGSVRAGFDPVLDGMTRRLTQLMKGAPWERMQLNSHGMDALAAAETAFANALLDTYRRLHDSRQS